MRELQLTATAGEQLVLDLATALARRHWPLRVPYFVTTTRKWYTAMTAGYLPRDMMILLPRMPEEFLRRFGACVNTFLLGSLTAAVAYLFG